MSVSDWVCALITNVAHCSRVEQLTSPNASYKSSAVLMPTLHTHTHTEARTHTHTHIREELMLMRGFWDECKITADRERACLRDQSIFWIMKRSTEKSNYWKRGLNLWLYLQCLLSFTNKIQQHFRYHSGAHGTLWLPLFNCSFSFIFLHTQTVNKDWSEEKDQTDSQVSQA